MKYRNNIEEGDYIWLKGEIIKLREKGREKENIVQRRELIRYLYDELGFPFYKIGSLLHKHHTTIMHNYYGT